MKEGKENIILNLTFGFALRIIIFTEELEKHKKYIIARQLLKSGTAIGALVRESQRAESRADFIHKLKIASKEAEETEYWLLLCKHADNYPDDDELLANLLIIKKTLSKIIFSTIKNRSVYKNQ